MKERAFENIKIFTIKIGSLNNKMRAKNLQYSLLVDDEVLRAHVDLEKGKVKLAVVESLNAEKVLEKFPKELEAKVEGRQEIPYNKLLKEAYHF